MIGWVKAGGGLITQNKLQPKEKEEKMSSYCDTCDNTMKKTTSYLVDGQRFNYCANCVQDNGYYGKEGK